MDKMGNALQGLAIDMAVSPAPARTRARAIDPGRIGNPSTRSIRRDIVPPSRSARIPSEADRAQATSTGRSCGRARTSRTNGRNRVKRLTPSIVEQYERDGYYYPLEAMPAGDALAYVQRLEAAEAEHGRGLDRVLRAKCHVVLTWADDLIRTPAILDAVEDLIGPDILCWSTQLFAKDANTPDYVSWHQDFTYWGLDEPSVVNVWVALTHSTPENGNLRVVPGSHLAPLPHRDTFSPDNILSRGQEIVDVDEAKAVDLPLRPGEMSLHHPLVVHGSRPNCSSSRRVGFAIRYIPPRMRQVVGSAGWASLVRGEDRYEHFQLLPRPQRDFDAEMVALHRRIQVEIDERKAIIVNG
jgi:non-heme Fe2+,alpha-ketoglutarate-dependent halogenase